MTGLVAVDASVIVEIVSRGPRREAATRALLGAELVAPAHLDAEVASALRRAELAGRASPGVTGSALRALQRLPVTRLPLELLAVRSRRWWPNASAYDALYLAAAEQVGADRLVTRDRRWLGIPDLPVPVLVVR